MNMTQKCDVFVILDPKKGVYACNSNDLYFELKKVIICGISNVNINIKLVPAIGIDGLYKITVCDFFQIYFLLLLLLLLLYYSNTNS